MQIDKIPLNQNQKVNKKALPTPELKQEETTSSFVAPKTDLQKTICDIYSEVLGLERVGITDNFFLIGGTSILATKVAMKCMLKGLHVVYSEIFQYAMPAELAAYLEGKEVNDSASSSVEVATDSDKEESETTVDQPWRKALVYNNSEHVGLLDITPTHTYLLTGATGFLGVHILNYIIENTDATVYCLVRKGSFDSPEERLEGICFYYFNKSYADLVGKRIFCIDGEIDNKTLAITEIPYGKTTGTVIDSILKAFEKGKIKIRKAYIWNIIQAWWRLKFVALPHKQESDGRFQASRSFIAME